MNLRQKCKKLKQENNRLRRITAVSTPISYTLNGSSVVTLGNKKMIPDFESREPLYGRMENSINNTVNKMIMDVEETQDAFIFRTLSDFARNSCGVIVEKVELVQAIQLIRMMKEYGFDIFERYDTATQQSRLFSSAYNEGLRDGTEKGHRRIVDILGEENDL